MKIASRSGIGIWSGSAGPSSGNIATECTANCGPLPMHRFSNSETGTGFVLGLPKMSIQVERTYLTPAFSSFAFASSMRPLSGIASVIDAA